MAFNGLKVIHVRLDSRINYILNPAKTGNGLYTGGVNTTPPSAYADMHSTKLQFDKSEGRLGYHLIQSFSPGEITPLEAMKLGREFINRYLHGHYEVVYSVHTDHDHVHLHFIWNSVSFIDGRKYHAPPGAYLDEMRRLSDEICRERGYSVIREGEKMNEQPYAAWKAEQAGENTLRDQIRHDMDTAIRASMTWTSFIREMQHMGYQFKTNCKYPAIKAPGHPRYVRIKSLGQKYTQKAIIQRILRQQVPQRPPKANPHQKRRVNFKGNFKLCKVTWKSIRALYYHYLYLIRKAQRKQETFFQDRQVYMRLREVQKLRVHVEQIRFLSEHKIDTMEQLREYSAEKQKRIATLIAEREPLYTSRRRAKTPEEAASISKEIDALNETLKTCRKEEKLYRKIETESLVMREMCRRAYQPKKEVDKVRSKEREMVR